MQMMKFLNFELCDCHFCPSFICPSTVPSLGKKKTRTQMTEQIQKLKILVV
jgi:hypothetical protein